MQYETLPLSLALIDEVHNFIDRSETMALYGAHRVAKDHFGYLLFSGRVGENFNPEEIAEAAIKYAENYYYDILFQTVITYSHPARDKVRNAGFLTLDSRWVDNYDRQAVLDILVPYLDVIPLVNITIKKIFPESTL